MDSGTAIREALGSNAKLVTIDFWDTIVLRTAPPRVVLELVAREVKDALQIPLDARTLSQRYLELLGAMGRLLEELGFDHEPRSSSVWRALLDDLGVPGHALDSAVSSIGEIEIRCHSSLSVAAPALPNIDLDRVLVLSDNELSADQLRAIGLVHGIALPEILVSSEVLLAKRSGRLFRRILEDRYLAPHDVFHVGDNRWSDRHVPVGLDVRVPSEPLREVTWPDASVRPFRPRRPPSMSQGAFEDDLAFEVACFVDLVNRQRVATRSTDVVLMGSEGAFFSQLFDARRPGDDATYRVASLGRRDLLSATFTVDPRWTFTQWVLAGIDLNRIEELIEAATGNTPVEVRQLARAYCEDGRIALAAATNARGLGPVDMERILGLADSEGPVLVVDVGYRASAARALARLTDRSVSSCVMFGEAAYLWGGITSSSYMIEIGDLLHQPRAERGDVVPKVSLTLPIETLLADGPRAPVADTALAGIRGRVLAGAKSFLGSERVPVRHEAAALFPAVWWQLADRPPGSVARAVLASRHHDDLAGPGSTKRHRSVLLADVAIWRGGAMTSRGPILERVLLLGLAGGRAVKDVRRLTRTVLQRG